jgi:UDP-N-acetyl-D-glucosamine dehydrogenase
VFIAVRALVDAGGRVDLEPLEAAEATIRSWPGADRLILVETTLPPGTTRSFADRLAGLPHGDGIFVAHTPERLSVGHNWRDFRRIPHLAGGVDAAAGRLALRVLSRLCETVVPVSCPEVSELSKLLENAFITVGAALAGEITGIAGALGIEASEVCAAAATKSQGYHAFHPGPGVGGHCLPNDLRMLAGAARALGREAPLLDGAAMVTARMPSLVADRLESRLARSGLALAGARVLLVGVGFKIGSSDTAETPARDVIRVLRGRGALPCYLDHSVASFEVDGIAVPRIDAAALARETFPGGIVLAGDPSIEASLLRGAVRILLDAGGGRVLRGAPGDMPRL